jgi:hypothetical protein
VTQIIVRILPDGHIQAEVSGIKGKSCAAYISVLEQLLSAETIASRPTPDYFAEAETEVSSTVSSVSQEHGDLAGLDETTAQPLSRSADALGDDRVV